MANKNQPQLRLVISATDSAEGGGYRSGRSSCRETPLRASTASTRSAGIFPVLIQREMLPCELNPSALASAVCPPTASQALATGDGRPSDSTGSALDMSVFNAHFVNSVNAYGANELQHTQIMGREPELEPSQFWKRLAEAWETAGINPSQNNVAKKLGWNGNGTTGRWFRGEALPQLDELIKIADIGHVTIDWLVTGREPRARIIPGSDSAKMLNVWDELSQDNRPHALRAAEGELARQKQDSQAAPANKKGPARRMGAP